jgi:betaine reductase
VLSAIPLIPVSTGANRVVKGIRVEHVCGNPLLSPEDDLQLQLSIVRTALQALQTPVDRPTLFDPDDRTQVKEAVHADTR